MQYDYAAWYWPRDGKAILLVLGTTNQPLVIAILANTQRKPPSSSCGTSTCTTPLLPLPDKPLLLEKCEKVVAMIVCTSTIYYWYLQIKGQYEWVVKWHKSRVCWLVPDRPLPYYCPLVVGIHSNITHNNEALILCKPMLSSFCLLV
jgi:hypothetical protein